MQWSFSNSSFSKYVVLSKVWPGVWIAVKVILPILNWSLSLAIIASKSGSAFGPYTIDAPVFFARLKCPLTKSAWKCVSKTYLIFEFDFLANSIYSEISLSGSITAASPSLSI